MNNQNVSENIKTILKDLAAHGPAPKRSAVEEQLIPHRDLLLKAIAKGNSLRSIAVGLKSAGVMGSLESIRRGIQRVTGFSKSGSRKKTEGT